MIGSSDGRSSLRDRTHRADAQCWVASANGHPDFPIQNLPLGVFETDTAGARLGIAIGDAVVDVGVLVTKGFLSDEARSAVERVSDGTLNQLMTAPPSLRRALRFAVFDLLEECSPKRGELEALGNRLVIPSARCSLLLPATVGDYTDFNAGIHHARKAGAMFRPDNPLLPNYKHVPLAYHGRASTVRASGGPVRRPRGQLLPPGATEPALLTTRKFDYEFEMGVWLGRAPAEVAIGEAAEAIFGYGLVNDWSARDLQRWEAAPLGPFLSKNFATVVSPWIITPEALVPFRVAQTIRPEGDPRPLPYLWDETDQAEGAIAITLTLLLRTPAMRAAGLSPEVISQASSTDLYWTPAQMVTHHGVNGCELRPGDLLGTGTISSLGDHGGGCLLELTADGRNPLHLANGEQRTYLLDGDEVILRGRCDVPGAAPIGFGDCYNIVVDSGHNL